MSKEQVKDMVVVYLLPLILVRFVTQSLYTPFMHWTYRIFRHQEDGHEWYTLNEYFIVGKKRGWTEGECHSESPEELIETLEIMLSDAKKNVPVLDFETGKPIKKL